MSVKILKMNDRGEDYRVDKGLLFDLPMRLMVVGKSQNSGKSNFLGNLLLRPYDSDDVTGRSLYANDFEGRNIYVVCPSVGIDKKWTSIIESKKIPKGNVYDHYDEQELEALYDRLESDFLVKEAQGKPEHVLIIMDDCSFSGSLRDKIHGLMAKLFCNSRHLLINTIVTSQKYSDILTTARENATGCIFYGCTQKQLELIYNDHGVQDKKDFIDMFRKATREKYTFLAVNYSNDPDERFLDSTFTPIKNSGSTSSKMTKAQLLEIYNERELGVVGSDGKGLTKAQLLEIINK
jgi:hypothetical protein